MSITVALNGPYSDGIVYDSRYDSEYGTGALSRLVYTAKLNAAGSAEITFPAKYFSRTTLDTRAVPYRTVVEIRRNETLLFRGRVLLPSDDFYKNRTVMCEGEFNFLCDSVVSAGTLSGTPAALLSSLISAHNSQVDAFKRFTVGSVTVSPSVNPSVDLKEATTTAAALTKLIEQVGGIIRFDTVNGSRTISWLSSAGQNLQPVHYGVNLIDFTETYSASDICNRVIAFGKSNNNSRLALPAPGYVQDTDAQAAYGIISKPVIFNECETVADLAAKATEYLSEHKSPIKSITVKAVDLSAAGLRWHASGSESFAISPFDVGKTIEVVSAPHGINGTWLLTQMTCDLFNPQNDRITLGAAPTPLSGIVANQ